VQGVGVGLRIYSLPPLNCAILDTVIVAHIKVAITHSME